MIERYTETGLDWLGDVGGLYDGLNLIVRLVLMLLPFTNFFFREELLQRAEAGNLIKIRKEGDAQGAKDEQDS